MMPATSRRTTSHRATLHRATLPGLLPSLLLALLGFTGWLPDPAFAGSVDPSTWPQWRGPGADGLAVDHRVLDGPEGRAPGFAVAWKKTLGSGYSSVSIAEGRAVTLFTDGASDFAAALDADTGRELWRYRIAEMYRGHDGSHDGPISTPLLSEGRVVGLGPRGHLFALDAATGEELWKTHLKEDHGAAEPLYGFTTSPLLVDGVLVVELGRSGNEGNGGNDGNGGNEEGEGSDGGVEGTTVAGFDPATGERLWIAGSDGVQYQSPAVLTVDGTRQVLAVGNERLYGLGAGTGEVLWEIEHGGVGATIAALSLNPVPAGEGRVFLRHKPDETRMVQVRRTGDGGYAVEDLWTSRYLRNSYAVPIYHDGYLYGYTSRFLTCLDAATGEPAWRSRQPGDGFVIGVDGHLVIVTKDGGVHLAEATPEEYREVASLELFEDLAWTPASFAGGRVYARSLGEIAALELGAAADVHAAFEDGSEVSGRPPAGSRFAAFLAEVEALPEEERPARVDDFMESVASFPMIEPPDRVHFLFRGDVGDVALAGDLVGARRELPLYRVEGTDLFYRSARVDPDLRVHYFYIRDFEDNVPDPHNPRKISSLFGEMSWLAMPRWREPDHLGEPEGPRGRVETVELESEHFEETRRIDVYLPPGYDEKDNETRRYPVAYVHDARLALELGKLPEILDHLAGRTVEPLIVAFLHQLPPGRGQEYRGLEYPRSFTEEIVPYLDERYRTIAEPEARASLGMGFAGAVAFHAALAEPGAVGRVGTQSLFALDADLERLRQALPEADEVPLELYLDWGRKDFRSAHEAWDLRDSNRRLTEMLRERGYRPHTAERPGGFGWAHWRIHVDRLFETLFPLAEAPGGPAASGER